MVVIISRHSITSTTRSENNIQIYLSKILSPHSCSYATMTHNKIMAEKYLAHRAFGKENAKIGINIDQL